MFEINSLVVALLICAPAVYLATLRSSWLIDYLFFVVSLNRCVRRIIDYHNGFFNPFSFISLTPIIVGGLATLIVVMEINQKTTALGKYTSTLLTRYLGLTGFAFLVGFIHAKFGAVYALGDYIAPIGLMGYAASRANDPALIGRWGNSFAASAFVVAVYGIWQFYTIPPWDAFWLVKVGFVGYMGTPEPGKMTLFSTMAERGPAGTYLSGGLMLLLLRPGTLSLLRWPAIFATGFAMLLTYSRTAVIFAGLAVLLYPLLNRGTHIWKILLLVGVAIVAGPAAMSRLPGQAASRVGTISNISEDSSFKGRIGILKVALGNSITNPWGLGIGAHGLALRVNATTNAGVGDSTGYVETLNTYGFFGFIVYVGVLWRIWKSSRELTISGCSDPDVRIFRAWFLAGMVALFSGNWLVGASFFWVLAGYCIGLYDLELNEAPETEAVLSNYDIDGE